MYFWGSLNEYVFGLTLEGRIMLVTLDNLNFSAFKFNEETAMPVEKMCEPLLKFGISNFGYVKIHQDGTMLRLSADKEWSRKYFLSQYYNDPSFYHFEDIPENGSRVRIYTNMPTGGVYSELYDHNIWNIYTLYERGQDSAEVWFFASTRENTGIIDFYINHQDILERFMLHFKEQAGDLMKTNSMDALIKTELKINESKRQEESAIKDFLTQIGKYNKDKKLFLSGREMECVQHLMAGKSTKEIAKFLTLSPRTVEFYINNIKRKAQCKKMCQLLKILFEAQKIH